MTIDSIISFKQKYTLTTFKYIMECIWIRYAENSIWIARKREVSTCMKENSDEYLQTYGGLSQIMTWL